MAIRPSLKLVPKLVEASDGIATTVAVLVVLAITGVMIYATQSPGKRE